MPLTIEQLTSVELACEHALRVLYQHSELKQQLAALQAKNEAWQETAAQFARDKDFYHRLVTNIGETFGIAAKTSYDGSVQQDVLVLKVPELVAALQAKNEKLRADNEKLHKEVNDLNTLQREERDAQEADEREYDEQAGLPGNPADYGNN